MRNNTGQVQREVISSRDHLEPTRVEGRIVASIHGFLKRDQKEPASLLVFQFEFHPQEPRHRIKLISVQLEFADLEDRGGFAPEVHNMAPDNDFAIVTREGVPTVVTTLRASDVPQYLSGRRRQSATGGWNSALWTLYEGATRKGINCSLRTAVLLKRNGNQMFGMKLKLNVKISPGSILGLASRFLRGNSEDDDQIIFNPTLSPTAGHIDRYALGDIDRNALGEVDLAQQWNISFQDGILTGTVTAPVTLGPAQGETSNQVMWDFVRGLYPDMWYKFKRFESLSLLNLYHYQDKLIQLEKKISEARGEMVEDDITNLANLLREYHKALKSFKYISQMDRPSGTISEKTAKLLSSHLGEKRYVDGTAGDTYGMVDLTPKALGVPADPIRVFLQTVPNGHDGSHLSGFDRERKVEMERAPPGKPPPPKPILNISPQTDKTARVLIALTGCAFLIGAMYALAYVQEKKYQLMTVVLFVVPFAVVLALGSGASNQEVLAGTAGYIAVLVIFVSQSH